MYSKTKATPGQCQRNIYARRMKNEKSVQHQHQRKTQNTAEADGKTHLSVIIIEITSIYIALFLTRLQSALQEK